MRSTPCIRCRGRGLISIRTAAIAIVLLALAVRVAGALETAGHELTFDARDFDRHARSIAAGEGYPDSLHHRGGPTALRPPAYPAVLALAYRVRGSDPPPQRDEFLAPEYAPPAGEVRTGRIEQALIGTLAVALIGVVALQLWGARVALVSMAIAALYAPLIALGFQLYSDPLFVVFELGAVAAALRARAAPTRATRWVLAAGCLVGLAWLTRTNGGLLAIPLALLVWTGRPRLRPRALAAPAALIVAAFLTVAPWTIRNAVVMDAFIPVSDNSGYTLAGTYNRTSANDAHYRAGWRPAELDPANARLIARSSGELDEARRLGRSAREYMRDHPGYIAQVGWCNSLRFLLVSPLFCGDASSSFKRGYMIEAGLPGPLALATLASIAVVALLAVGGAFTRAARAAPRVLWLTPAALWTVVFVLPGNRFRAPIEPFMIMLAALALVAVARRLATIQAARRA